MGRAHETGSAQNLLPHSNGLTAIGRPLIELSHSRFPLGENGGKENGQTAKIGTAEGRAGCTRIGCLDRRAVVGRASK